jgi:hypothetical protein
MAKTVNEAFARQLKNMQAQQKHIAEQRAEMSGMIG